MVDFKQVANHDFLSLTHLKSLHIFGKNGVKWGDIPNLTKKTKLFEKFTEIKQEEHESSE